MSQLSRLIPTSGPGSGTVTSISAGEGITLTPNPITTTGTVALTVPVSIADGGTNAITMTNTDGVNYFNGTSIVTTVAGTTGQFLGGNTGSAPTFQSLPASSISITGDGGGTVTGASFTFNGHTNSGSTVEFTAAGSTVSLNVTDANDNTLIGKDAGIGPVTGTENTALGFQGLSFLSSGINNTAVGTFAGAAITTGSNNIAIGRSSLLDLVSGSSNITIGSSAGSAYTTNESNNIILGPSSGTIATSGEMRLGDFTNTTKTYIAGIDGVNVGSVAKVVTMASNQLGTATITAGSGISVTPGANTITIAATGAANPVTTLHSQDGNNVTATAGVINISGGNSLTTTGTVGPNTLTVSLSGVTQYNVQTGGASNALNNVAPTATSGVPLISQGAAAQPIFGTALVAGGGTGSTSFNTTGVVISGATGTTALSAITLTDGQLAIGSSTGNPAAATLTAGTNISITNGHNSITIAGTGAASFGWSVITANQTAAVNNGYFCNKAGTLALALPATSAIGDVIEVSNINTALGVQFTQAAGQQIFIGNTSTTLGATGTLTSSAVGDALKIVCSAANTTWRVVSGWGNWTPA